jgi:hypothetical protein
LIKEIKKDIKKIKYSNRLLRQFGILIGICFLIVSYFIFFKYGLSYFICIFFVLVIFTFSIFKPAIFNFAYKIWMIIAIILSWIISRIILILFFYMIMTPIGLILRIFKKDILDLRFSNSKTGYWVTKEYSTDKNRYKKQF